MDADSEATDEVRFVTVPRGGAEVRVDRILTDLTGLSRSYLQKLIAGGRLTRDGELLRANDHVSGGAILRLEVPRPVAADPQPEPDIAVTIVHEDPDLLIVDKPAGLVVHPGAGHADGTLVNALLGRAGGAEYGGIAGVRRPGIVHRLDRDTSGLLMVARHDAAQASLMSQLKARRVKKTYLALVQGNVAAAVGRVEAPVGRDPARRTRMAVVASGRPAVTGYRVRDRFPGWTLLELDLVTGRTHQIRVHLAAIGHPVAGDPLYGTGTSRRGPDGLGRLFLHAWRLELASPSDGHLIRTESPLPDELEGVLGALREGSDGASARLSVPDRGAQVSSLPAAAGDFATAGDIATTGDFATASGDFATASGAPGAMLVIISGPSGVGKDTVIAALRRRTHVPEYHYVVTCTTRPRRPYEVDGVHYRFLDRETFERLEREGEFLEANFVHDNWYGTPRSQVRDALAAGRHVILKIDVQGAQVVKENVSDALLIFLVPPSLEDLFHRLRTRATETADELDVRQRNAAIELARQDDYDYVVVNETDEVLAVAARVDEIIADEQRRRRRRRVAI